MVRSGPSLERLKIQPPDERLKRGRRYLVGYVIAWRARLSGEVVLRSELIS